MPMTLDPSILPTFTWASRPSSASLGQRIRVSDVGPAPGMVVAWDGVRWIVDGTQCLVHGGATASVTGSTNETTLASVLVPGGLLGVNGQIRIRMAWQVNGTAGTKTARLRYGGTAFWTLGFTSSINAEELLTLRAAGATNAQRCNTAGSFGITNPTASAFTNGSVDATADQSLILTGQLATSTDTIALLDFQMEICP